MQGDLDLDSKLASFGSAGSGTSMWYVLCLWQPFVLFWICSKPTKVLALICKGCAWYFF